MYKEASNLRATDSNGKSNMNNLLAYYHSATGTCTNMYTM